jgi:hypothetical protein
MLANGARRKNAISFSFFNPYQTSSTENVLKLSLAYEYMKVIIKFKKILQRFYLFFGALVHRKNVRFFWPLKMHPSKLKILLYARNYTLSIPDSPV